MTQISQKQRGIIIKIPSNEAGIIMAGGRQWPFRIEGVWTAAIAPAVNQSVEISLNDLGSEIISVAVIDSQTLAKEKLGQFADIAGSQGLLAADVAKNNLGALAARMGSVILGTSVVLWIGWFFLPSLHVNMGFASLSLTFSEVLGFAANKPQAGGGWTFFSFLGLVAILGPWVRPWLVKPWAPLLNAAPFGFVIITFVKIKWDLHSAVSEATKGAKAFGGQQAADFAGQMMKGIAEQIVNAISFGWGFYVVVAASLVLAGKGILEYVGAKGRAVNA